MPPTNVDLTTYHGDTWAQTFRLKTGSSYVNLAGATVSAWAKDSQGAVTPLTAAVTNAANGEVTISGLLPAGGYAYDLEVALAGQVTTWVRGTLVVQPDIAHG